MTIEKEGSSFLLICDVCGNAADATFLSFQEAVSFKKECEWKSQQYRGEWEDVCPECSQEGEGN